MDALPRTMRDPAEVERRRAMLGLPHIAPLANFAVALRQKLGCEVPDFDPLDSGVEAQILFLFEKPGPMTAVDGRGRRTGSGFISRDNNDGTAEATFHFMRQAGIPRRNTILWNTVPGWNGTTRVTAEELHVGVSCLQELAGLLVRLQVIVLVGKKAQSVRAHLSTTSMTIISSPHPSPRVRACWPEKWKAIEEEWSKARIAIQRSGAHYHARR